MEGFLQKNTMIRLKNSLKMKVTLTVYDETRRETWGRPELYNNAAGDDEIPNEGTDTKVKRERMMPKL